MNLPPFLTKFHISIRVFTIIYFIFHFLSLFSFKSQIDKIQKAYSVAQNEIDTYKQSCDDLETRWLNLQQVLSSMEAKDLLKAASSISPPSSPTLTRPSNQLKQIRSQMIELQAELLELTNYTASNQNSNVTLTHELNQLESLLQSVGDRKPQQSISKLLDDLQLTTKRLETIGQALEMNFEMFHVKDMDQFSIHFIKKLNFIFAELQNIQSNLSDCKLNLNDARIELTGKMTSLPDEKKLSPIYANFSTTLNQYNLQCNNVEKQINQLIAALNSRVKQTEQLATLRQNVSSSLKKVRESRQQYPDKK
ncbi:unnamed protein product [Trichobilharzia regenti]|nr:unnamed protein product [Trichobilharzia regenti]